ncbi:methylated-DNA--[protein]-cysteine S-methyltransferase [Clostridium sp. AF32-12BH]|jgi:methylated-DNA-[protein]-cysteine S-methyltransferase|uniref:methylated-DNA--[protein]-cysteine S-methyltransferase n=1 Tax=Clostridium sp. AF32-12BH TaxID=2292006 RepID=UPI000E4EE440|nr:methylated-DNA--[protein]-cysteine S-methyltransferase [Clostridium sp. AF32-12BH]RHP44693.1 methylated-DNA--[protein]-cysteine S-methyltransferase [Clostridium sp. AF32-12BH]
MIYTSTYFSPLGTLLLAADSAGLTGLWLENGKYFADTLENKEYKKIEKTPTGIAAAGQKEASEILTDTRRWLDLYFQGKKPDFTPKLHLTGSDFRMEVWKLLLEIPYGQTVTYGALARKLADRHGLAKMSAQAVGGAVGHNPVSIIVPCHRVVGTNGSLTGYAGGIGNKVKLLELEHTDMSRFFIPQKGTAL